MSPRPYNLGRRNEQIDEGRRQIVNAALALLGESQRYTEFTVDAVAKRADVARGTVYYQFKSKRGLLEALCDELAERGGLSDLPRVFSERDPDHALAAFIECFARFWQADRTVMRRMRALAALDPDIRTVISARDQRRHDGLEELVRRFRAAGRAAPLGDHDPVDVLLAITSLELFDTIAGPDQDLTAVAPAVTALARAAIGLREDVAEPAA